MEPLAAAPPDLGGGQGNLERGGRPGRTDPPPTEAETGPTKKPMYPGRGHPSESSALFIESVMNGAVRSL